jgi:hypothetical protein
MTTHYLRVEAVNFDRYLYDTNDLSTIRGASYAIADVIPMLREVIRASGATDVQTISEGASVGFFRFDAASSDDAVNAVRQILKGVVPTNPKDLQPVLPHCTFVVDALASDDPLDARNRLLARNRWQQITSATLVYPAKSSANGAVCSEDRLRPAFGSSAAADDDHGPFSTATTARRTYGRLENKKRFAGVRLGDKAPLDWQQLVMSNDFEELAGKSVEGNRLDGHMAVIHADGNSFGLLVAQLAARAGDSAARRPGVTPQTPAAATLDELRRLDDQIRRSQRALMARLVDLCRGAAAPEAAARSSTTVQFEPLVWAGDEFTIVVPVRRMWDVLAEIFSHRVAIALPDGPFHLTYGAGVVVCEHKTPIAGVISLAHALADYAKKFLKKDAESGDDPVEHLQGFAYEVLDSYDHVGGNLDRYREKRRGSVAKEDLVIAGGDELGGRLRDAAEVIGATSESLSRSSIVRIANTLRAGTSRTRGDVQDLIARTEDEIDADSPTVPRPSERLRAALGGSYWLHLAELLPYIEVSAPSTVASVAEVTP